MTNLADLINLALPNLTLPSLTLPNLATLDLIAIAIILLALCFWLVALTSDARFKKNAAKSI